MSTRKYTTKGSRGRRKQTRKLDWSIHLATVSKKNNRKLTFLLPLSDIVKFKGGRKTDKDIIKDIQKIAPALKPVIDKVISLNKAEIDKNPPLVVYEKNKELFEKYIDQIEKKIGAEETIETISINEFDVMKKLVQAIIEDTSPALSGIIELIQNMLKKIHLYLINDIEIKDNMKILFKKRMTNNTPYIHIIHKRSGYESIYDANEMLALIRTELTSPKHDTSILKTLNINNKFTIGPPNSPNEPGTDEGKKPGDGKEPVDGKKPGDGKKQGDGKKPGDGKEQGEGKKPG